MAILGLCRSVDVELVFRKMSAHVPWLHLASTESDGNEQTKQQTKILSQPPGPCNKQIKVTLFHLSYLTKNKTKIALYSIPVGSAVIFKDNDESNPIAL